jgi:hypothetical protein
MREAVWAGLYQSPVCDVCDTPGPVSRCRLMFSGLTCRSALMFGMTVPGSRKRKSNRLRLNCDHSLIPQIS